MKTRVLLLITAACLAQLPVLNAATITLPEDHLSLTLPDHWRKDLVDSKSILLRAQSDSPQMALVLSKPYTESKVVVKDPDFQAEIQRTLRNAGFSKVVRSTLIQVAGLDAYLCEAATAGDKPISKLQVIWIHQGNFYNLEFASRLKPAGQQPDVRAIIESIKLVPNQPPAPPVGTGGKTAGAPPAPR